MLTFRYINGLGRGLGALTVAETRRRYAAVRSTAAKIEDPDVRAAVSKATARMLSDIRGAISLICKALGHDVPQMDALTVAETRQRYVDVLAAAEKVDSRAVKEAVFYAKERVLDRTRDSILLICMALDQHDYPHVRINWNVG